MAKVKVSCDYCKKITEYPSPSKASVFCSRSCANKSNAGRNRRNQKYKAKGAK